MIREFKPTLLFLTKFLVIYFLGNIIYGVYVESFGKYPDPITQYVTTQSSWLLNALAGSETYTEPNPSRPTVLLKVNKDTILSVFEGCNGINVMIVFIAFVIAFGGSLKRISWFLPAGILIIHLFNLLRIMLLYYTAIYQQRFFYYFHKYFFTAVLYLIVFALWALWIKLNVNFKKSVTE